jgi:periplasmic divalent cation tolerance protein
MRVVFCTAPKNKAEEMADKLLEEKLVACVNLVEGIKSKYWWDGKIQTDEETLMIIKTKKELIDPLTSRIKELHPYDVPEIIAMKIKGGSTEYLNWIKQVTLFSEQ